MANTNTKRRVGFLLLLICSIVYAVRGYQDQLRVYQSADFKTLYGMSRCLLQGCDPYDSDQISRAYGAAGGPMDDPGPFRQYEPLYMPPALALVAPLALFPWAPAHLLWLGISTGVFIVAAFLIAELCAEFSPILSLTCLGVLVLSSTPLIMLAQPAQLTIGLCGIATWCIIRNRYAAVGIVAFAISLAFKPHVSGLVWLYFLISRGMYSKRAMQVLAVVVAICLPSILWASLMPASSHWLTEIPRNIAGITATGNVGDPGPRNQGAWAIACLQGIFSVLRDEPRFYNRAAQLSGILLLCIWAWPAVRMPRSRERDYLALATVVCISLLPVYHWEYDSRLLLLTLPGLALMMLEVLWLRVLSCVLMLATLVMVTHNYHNLVLRLVFPHLAPDPLALGHWATIFWLRPVPIMITALACFFLWRMYSALRRKGHAA